MQFLTRRQPLFNLKLEYGRSRLFLSLHAEYFKQRGLKENDVRWELPGAAFIGQRPSWKHTAVAVQYHDRGHGTFWQTVVPALPELRERYVKSGGKLLVVASVREPLSMIISWYRQWPARLPNRTIAPFRDFLANASGLLTRALTYGPHYGPSKIWHTTRVPYFACPEPLAALARHRLLSTFDLVGDVADLGWTLRTLILRCLGWPSTALPRETPHIAYHGGHRNKTLRETSNLKSGDGPDSTWCRLERAARCDRPLYEATRGGRLFGTQCGTIDEPSRHASAIGQQVGLSYSWRDALHTCRA